MSSITSDPRFSGPFKKEFIKRDAAASGDLVWVCTPSTVAPAPTAAAWTRDVTITLETAAGDIHTWYDADITSGISIADAGGGTASITDTTLEMRNGKAVVTVSGTEATWANSETDTLTVEAATIMGASVAEKTSVETFTTPT